MHAAHPKLMISKKHNFMNTRNFLFSVAWYKTTCSTIDFHGEGKWTLLKYQHELFSSWVITYIDTIVTALIGISEGTFHTIPKHFFFQNPILQNFQYPWSTLFLQYIWKWAKVIYFGISTKIIYLWFFDIY